MPFKQYRVFKKAVEVKEFERRKRYISDTAMAFSDPNKAIAQINKDLMDLKRNNVGSVDWEADKDSIKRAKRKWMR